MMESFVLVVGGRTLVVVARHIHAALENAAVRFAAVGAELRNAAGVTLATRERIRLADGFVESWLPTDAWRGDDAPMNLSQLRETLAHEGPVFRVIQGQG